MNTPKNPYQAAITFIGGGNMAQALISGLLAKGYSAKQLHVAEPNTEKRQAFADNGVQTYDSSDPQNTAQAINKGDVVILAVKPQVIAEALTPLKSQWHNQLVISILAGTSTQTLEKLLGKNTRLVRAMPNTPAMIQMGATGLYATPQVSEAQKQQAEAIMQAVGLALWVENEDLLHAVTAVSGSAPAYFFYLLEYMIATAESMGLDNTQATALAMQTAVGSTQIALTSHETPAELRKKVTSPNGTTQAAIEVMDAQHMGDTIAQAMQACVQRSMALSGTKS